MTIKSLDKAAIAGILNATDVQLPHDLDRDALCKDLNAALSFQEFYESSGSAEPRAKKRATEIKDCVLRLQELLKLTGDRALDIRLAIVLGRIQKLPDGGGRFDPQAEPLASIILSLEWLAERMEPIIKANPGPSKSTEMFITVALSKYYEKHLNRRVGRSRSSDGSVLGGPFIRFVQAVMNKAGMPVPTASTIETYLKRSRNGDKK